MQNRINLIILIFFVGNQLFAQSTIWMSKSDNLYPSHLCTDDSGYVYQSTYFDFPIVNIGTINHQLHGTKNAIITKYDVGGNIIWSKNIENGPNLTANHQIYNSIITPQYELWVIGQFTGEMYTGNFYLNSGSFPNFFILKLDPVTGNVLEADTGRISFNSKGLKLLSDKSQYTYMSGASQNNLTYKGVNVNLPIAGGSFLFKIDSTGSVIWGKGVERGSINGIVVNNNQDIFISGEPNNGLYISGQFVPIPAGGNSYIAKLDSNGTLCWAKFYSALKFEIGTIDSLGNIYYSSEINNTAILGKIDSSGNPCWDRSIQGSSQNWINSITINKDKHLLISGGYFTDITIGPFNFSGSAGMYIAIFDTSGQCTYAQQSQDQGVCYNQQTISILSEDIIFSTKHEPNLNNLNSNSFAIGNNILSYHPIAIPSHSSVIGRLSSKTNTLMGEVYWDNNNNGIKENGEYGINNINVSTLPLWGSVTSNFSGKFNISVDSGNYSINISNYPNYFSISGNPALTGQFNGYNNLDTGLQIGLYSPPGISNITLETTSLTLPRAGNQHALGACFKNKGSSTDNFNLIIENPNGFPIVSTVPPADSISGSTAMWKINNLSPFQSGFCYMVISIPTNAQIGDIVSSHSYTNNFLSDLDTSDNRDVDTTFVSGPYDPNFKVVTHKYLSPQEVALAPWLQYTVHFQNLGNDTAFNVFISDTLSAHLDWSTLEVVAYSDPVTFTMNQNGVTIFNFDNIKLPDSGIDLTGSCGFVKYRIRTKNNLQPGEIISNFADIYFDYNAPVRTDTAYTYINYLVFAEVLHDKSTINIYPNPIQNGSFQIKLNDQIKPNRLEIYSSQGQIVHSMKLNSESEEGEIVVNGLELPQGIYFCRLNAELKSIYFRICITH